MSGCLECLRRVGVDVEFEPVGEFANMGSRSPIDKIIKISKLFLEWEIID
jgi:hypothetical protein